MSIWTFDYWTSVENIFELQLVKSSQITLQGFFMTKIHRKEDRSPGILSGSERICLSWRSIIGIALP